MSVRFFGVVPAFLVLLVGAGAIRVMTGTSGEAVTPASAAADDQHPDMVYADGTRYVWNGQAYRNAADPPEQKPEKRVRPYHTAFTPEGSAYRLFDTCEIPHDRASAVRVPMSLARLRREMECDGEEMSETSVTGIRQKVLRFQGQEPKDTFVAVVQNGRVMHIQRGM